MIASLTPGQLRKLARNIEKEIQEGSGEKCCFMLITFPFGKPGQLGQYISNGDRSDMVSASQELATYLKGTTEDILPNQRH